MWSRTRQFAQASLFGRTGTNTPQATPAMPQQNQNPQPEASTGKDKKASEPLFGPSIGPVSGGPAWTLSNEKKVLTDELTPDIVTSWIEKSKEVSSLYPEANENTQCFRVLPCSFVARTRQCQFIFSFHDAAIPSIHTCILTIYYFPAFTANNYTSSSCQSQTANFAPLASFDCPRRFLQPSRR